jgi:chondroitin 4-sulfotransferase 11
MIRKAFNKIKGLIIEPNSNPLRKGKTGNYIFIHINKTGGTSIADAIGLPNKRHLTVKEVISIVGQRKFDEAFVFAVTRNPWDRVVSHYKYRVKTNQNNMANNPISFKEWVSFTYGKNKNTLYYDNPKMFASQSDWLKGNDGIIKVGNIVRFESIVKDFEKIVSLLDIEKKLPHLNQTKRDSYAKYYDEETAEIVRNWFIEDIQRFNYEFKR